MGRAVQRSTEGSLKINIGGSIGKCSVLDQVEEICYAQILGTMLAIFPGNVTETG